MNSNTARDRETYKFYQAAINALDLRLIAEAPQGCPVPPHGFVPRACKDTALTAFTQLGALRLNVDRAMISLMDRRYQYILAEATRTMSLLPDAETSNDLWLGSVIIPRSQGVCEHVLNLGHLVSDEANTAKHIPAVVVDDLFKDPRFAKRSYVSGPPWIRFYAGVPLRSPWGTIVGAYCVFGHEPRNGLNEDSLRALQELGSTTMNYLETSKAREGHRRYEQMLHGLTSFVTGESSLHALGNRSQMPTKNPRPTLHESTKVDIAINSEIPTHTASKAASSSDAQPLPEKQKTGNNKRTRTASGPPAVRRKKYTTSWQEDLLPIGAKEMFSRVSKIIRESTDLDGIILFDASMAAFGSAIHTPQGRSSMETEARRTSVSVSSSSDTGSSMTSDSAVEEDWDSEELRSGSDVGRPHKKRMCEVLGFATMQGSSIAGDEAELSCAPLAESDMKRLLRRYPFGHIFSITPSGAMSNQGPNIPPPSMAPATVTFDCPEFRPQGSLLLNKDINHPMLQKLLTVAPEARSIAFLPLWDYRRERWVAGCLCWTTESNRALYSDVELIYLQTFGNSIMMELSRLDAITSDRAKTTFVASISHELRCPLHGILGGIQFLQDTHVDRFQAGMLDSVAMCGKTLLDTIDHVLDFAKVNSFAKAPSRQTLKIKDLKHIRISGNKAMKDSSAPTSLTANVDLALLTEEVVEAVFVGQTHRGVLSQQEYLTEKKVMESSRLPHTTTVDRDVNDSKRSIRVVLDIPNRSSWIVKTQPGAWRRVVMNLFGNALKYTKAGMIHVSLHAKRPKENPEDTLTEITLLITDTGKGISPEFLHSGLYTPFQQEDKFSAGTGLGLSIVRQIVESLRGKIDLKSEVNVGTEVKLTLKIPLAREEPPSPDDESNVIATVASKLEKYTVCVLEEKPTGSFDGAADAVQRGRYEFTRSLLKILRDWFRADTTITNDWESSPADVIMYPEPRLDILDKLRDRDSQQKRLLVLFIAPDAIQAAKMRADRRVQDAESIVDIITQPCGPRKLANSLSQGLDRLENETLLTVTPIGSPLVIQSFNDTNPLSRAVNCTTLPHAASIQTTRHGRVNSILDPETIPKTLLENRTVDSLPIPTPEGSRFKILIVDDNRINLSLLAAFMKKYNFYFQEAMDGLQAVQRYREANGEFDYVLMDLTMPVMDGMAATREIRLYEDREGLSPTIVIALTGLGSASARVEALNSGINCFLTKPVKFQALYQILKENPPAFNES